MGTINELGQYLIKTGNKPLAIHPRRPKALLPRDRKARHELLRSSGYLLGHESESSLQALFFAMDTWSRLKVSISGATANNDQITNKYLAWSRDAANKTYESTQELGQAIRDFIGSSITSNNYEAAREPIEKLIQSQLENPKLHQIICGLAQAVGFNPQEPLCSSTTINKAITILKGGLSDRDRATIDHIAQTIESTTPPEFADPTVAEPNPNEKLERLKDLTKKFLDLVFFDDILDIWEREFHKKYPHIRPR